MDMGDTGVLAHLLRLLDLFLQFAALATGVCIRRGRGGLHDGLCRVNEPLSMRRVLLGRQKYFEMLSTHLRANSSSELYPRCITMSWNFGGNPYFNFACGKTGASNIYSVGLTYTGFATPIYLPLMVDNYGVVTENTIFPSPTVAPPPSTETVFADPGGTISSTDSQPTTTAANPANQESSPSDLGFREIIAIVVPICTLLIAVLGLCFRFLVWKRDGNDRPSYDQRRYV